MQPLRFEQATASGCAEGVCKKDGIEYWNICRRDMAEQLRSIDQCMCAAMAMATKVHDEQQQQQVDGGGEQEYAEVDIILAQAKRELQQHHRKQQRRHMNLSDIPENFAHVPPSDEDLSSEAYYSGSTTATHRVRPVSLDTSQPDFASLAGHHNHHPKLHVLGIAAPIKWLRAYISCLVATTHDDSAGSQHSHRRRRRRGRTA